jgi:hypothetical protein
MPTLPQKAAEAADSLDRATNDKYEIKMPFSA